MNPSAGTMAPDAASTTGKARLAPATKRLFGFIVPLNIAIYMVAGAVPSILLPLQIQAIDAANKATNLALVAGIGAIAALVASPIAGLVSDRTRSMFGKRTPWLVIGSLVTGLLLVGMGFANGIASLAIAWVVTQIALNFVISPLTAIMPDRIPSRVRGIFSTLSGVGLMTGILVGQIAGAALSFNIRLAYLILPGILLIVVVIFVLANPDSSSVKEPREPFSVMGFLQTFWVSPRKHPDFFYGFMSRLLLFTGYFTITGYQLYVLQDYIGLGDGAVKIVPLLGTVNLVALIVAMGISGPLSDRLGRRKPVVTGAGLLLGVAMAIPLVAPTVTGMLVFTALTSLGFGAYMAVDAALMSELLPSAATYAKDLGVLNIAATLPQSIGPFLGGAIVVSVGYHALFPIATVLGVVGALCIVPIKSVR